MQVLEGDRLSVSFDMISLRQPPINQPMSEKSESSHQSYENPKQQNLDDLPRPAAFLQQEEEEKDEQGQVPEKAGGHMIEEEVKQA